MGITDLAGSSGIRMMPISPNIYIYAWFIHSCRFLTLSRLSGKYPVTGSCSSVLSSTNPSFQETTGVADPKPFIKLFDNEPKQHFRFGAAGSCDQIYNGGRMGCHFPESLYHPVSYNIFELYLIVFAASTPTPKQLRLVILWANSKLQENYAQHFTLRCVLCVVDLLRVQSLLDEPKAAAGDGWRFKLIASFFRDCSRSRVAWYLWAWEQ